jgi:hypothetical protein
VSTKEFDITGGNYSTADVDTARSSNKIFSMDGNYSTLMWIHQNPPTKDIALKEITVPLKRICENSPTKD